MLFRSHDEYRKGEQEQVEEYRRKEREFVALHSGGALQNDELMKKFRKKKQGVRG